MPRPQHVLAPIALVLAMTIPADASPHFWMNDLRLESRAGVELSVGNPPGPAGDVTTFTTDVFAKFDLAGAILLSVRLPLALGFFEDPIDGDDSGVALGNVGLGITGVRAWSSRGTAVRTGLGGVLYLPTASDSGDAGLVASAAQLLAIPDQGRWANATTARGRADLILQPGAFFFQMELNLDLLFQAGDDDVDLAIGLGPGFDLTPTLSLMAELSIANITDDSLIVFDLGMRYQAPGLMLGWRLYLPAEQLGGEDVIGAGFDVAARF